MTGCAWFPKKTPPLIETKSRVELAIAELDEQWLKECDGLGPPPANSVGDLLTDGTNAMVLLSVCRNTHNSLVRYLRPLVVESRK